MALTEKQDLFLREMIAKHFPESDVYVTDDMDGPEISNYWVYTKWNRETHKLLDQFDEEFYSVSEHLDWPVIILSLPKE